MVLIIIKNKHKFVQIGFTNCYLLKCNGGYLLIDVGYPGDYEKFIQKLKNKFNIDILEIKYLLLTHHHDDHAGFGNELLKNTKANLIVHEKALKRLKMGASEEESRPINRRIKAILGIFSRFHEFKFPPVIPTDKDVIIRGSEDNTDILKNLGIEGTIIHTPGHTKDGISVILSDGSVFPGDNTMNVWYFNLLGLKKRPIYVQDFLLILNSWEKYIELGGKKVYPAHGKAFNIKKLQKKLKKFSKNY